jgi:Flp pilus assembly protein TadD
LNRAWRAIPLLEQFLKESPTAAAWNTLGLLQDSSGDFVAGETAYRAAVALTPTSDRWHNNLGNNLLLQNKADEAEREFRLALELNPNSATARNNLATVLARKGDLEGALQEFLFASDEATARNNLAVVLMEFGRYEQSREELIKALAVRRNFAPALSNFKLVQDHIRERADLQKRPPQTKVRVASVEQEQSPYEQQKEQR